MSEQTQDASPPYNRTPTIGAFLMVRRLDRKPPA